MHPNTVTILIPVYKRFEGLKRLVKSIKRHTNYPYSILVLIDTTDFEIYKWAVKKGIDVVMTNWRKGWPKQLNLGMLACKTEYFFWLATDNEIVQDNWLRSSVQCFKKVFPDGKGILCCNDLLQRGQVATHFLSTKAFARDFGFQLLCEVYHHLYADKELTRLAKKIGKYHYCKGIVIKHHHYTVTTGIMDSCTQEAERCNPDDHALYEKRSKFTLVKEQRFELKEVDKSK